MQCPSQLGCLWVGLSGWVGEGGGAGGGASGVARLGGRAGCCCCCCTFGQMGMVRSWLVSLLLSLCGRRHRRDAEREHPGRARAHAPGARCGARWCGWVGGWGGRWGGGHELELGHALASGHHHGIKLWDSASPSPPPPHVGVRQSHIRCRAGICACMHTVHLLIPGDLPNPIHHPPSTRLGSLVANGRRRPAVCCACTALHTIHSSHHPVPPPPAEPSLTRPQPPTATPTPPPHRS